MFNLAVYGRLGDCQASVSVYDPTGRGQAIADRANLELGRLPRGAFPSDTRAGALVVLRRLGFGEANAGGWFEGPALDVTS